MEKHMKKLPFVLALLAILFSVPGCAAVTAWWDQFKSNPVEQVQVFEQGVSVAVSDAQVAFGVVKQFLPASTQVQAQTDFDNAIISVNHAMQALNDAVQAAVDAQTPNPDFTALITAVSDAVAQVVAIIDQYKAAPPAPAAATAAFGQRPADPMGLADAKAGVLYLRRFSKQAAPAPSAAAAKK
jgi:hypothetical protein